MHLIFSLSLPDQPVLVVEAIDQKGAKENAACRGIFLLPSGFLPKIE
jgi:hypothetical protein